MVMQAVTLNLPHTLYERFRLRAENNHRTIEAELLEVVTTAEPIEKQNGWSNQWEESSDEDQLPAKLEEELASLALLNDDALWRAARSHMPAEAAAQTEALNYKLRREGLTETEDKTLNNLLQEYDRYMLIRAQSMLLLQQRGYDISEFNPNL